MAATRTASLKSSAFFIIDGFYRVKNVICRKFSKDLIKIKEKDKKSFTRFARARWAAPQQLKALPPDVSGPHSRPVD